MHLVVTKEMVFSGIVKLFVAVLCLLLTDSYAYTHNKFIARSLGSNMVLQRDVSASLYGYAKRKSEVVSVSFDGKEYTTTSSNQYAKSGGYFWKVDLPPQVGGFTKYSIKVTSASGEQAILDNVVFGDVFLCAGQSNMQIALSADLNGTAEIADADNFPFIRLMSVGTDYSMPASITPLDDLHSVQKTWSEGSSVNVNGGDWGYISAVCWLSGKNIYLNSLHSQIPIGLVSSNWGGTYIEAWNPKEVKEQCNGTLGDAYKRKAPDANVNPNQVSILYNNMLAPFQHMKLTGILWYQGESNAVEPTQYICMKQAMLNTWRSLFQINFPFIYVQISTWNGGGTSTIANFRNAQYDILSVTDKVAMITAADLGDPDSEFGDIHPRLKSEIGRRIGLAASSLIYNVPQPHLGPVIESIESFEDTTQGWSVRFHFTQESCGSNGIQLLPAQVCPDSSLCAGAYLLYGDNNTKIDAQITIASPTSVEIKPVVKQDGKPSYFSYGQADYPMMTVYNDMNIPLVPYVWKL